MVDETEKQKIDPRQSAAIRALLTAALVVVGLWIMSGFLPALIWAAVIAIAVDPLCLRLASSDAGKRFPNLSAGLITLAVALTLIVPIVIGITRGGVGGVDRH